MEFATIIENKNKTPPMSNNDTPDDRPPLRDRITQALHSWPEHEIPPDTLGRANAGLTLTLSSPMHRVEIDVSDQPVSKTQVARAQEKLEDAGLLIRLPRTGGLFRRDT